VIGGDGKVIDTSGPGSFFGELALVYDVPRQANVITVDTCQFAVLSKANFSVYKSEYVPDCATRLR
jgi:CRP-like cAMP-binding protein